ncbi:cyclic nucleotide-binding domain-containing protein [bacterium]|nr:cyclic nucleotide-binding domain-containing protein [bacterium]MBU1065253.1 cyclic nucleotide-binding domain-containing protein [bacterium]MBU1633576.1 cyclic nucleotide-binding domain-containing protein [bacterium]MBU1872385.1 cyclic nucleotide-binding domain-containing protein [bacterium]
MSNPIWEAVESRKSKTADDIFKALKNVPIFSELNPREMNEIEKIIHRREYKKGEPIFRMGDPGLGMYIIIKGLVNIVEEDEAGNTTTLAVLKDGAFFGDLALLDEAPRSASAIADDDSDILGFFRPDFLDLLYRKSKLGIKILFSLAKIIGERLRRTNEQLAVLKKK